MRVEIINNSQHFFSQEELTSFLTLAEFAIVAMKLHSECELAISLVDEEEMRSLNLQWMGESKATDVLSFPMDEIRQGDLEPGLLGDIVLCPAYAQREAQKRELPLKSELELLIAHGFLHLLGFDHRESDQEREMFALQEDILRGWRT